MYLFLRFKFKLLGSCGVLVLVVTEVVEEHSRGSVWVLGGQSSWMAKKNGQYGGFGGGGFGTMICVMRLMHINRLVASYVPKRHASGWQHVW